MAVTQFDEATLLSEGGLEVSGPFDPQIPPGGEVLGDVKIRFLLIQERDEGPPVTVDDWATWRSGMENRWKATVSKDTLDALPHRFQEGKIARAIGLAVLVKRIPPPNPSDPPGPPDPPVFETVTWCVNVVVKPEGSGGS
jgi:hypothetical protein